MPSTPRVLLFDMGGVLVELTGLLAMDRWMKDPVSGEDLIVRWIHSPAVTLFETGQIPPGEFSRRVVDEFGLTVSPDRFQAAFRDFVGDFTGEMRRVISAIPPEYRKAVLTNTNVIHWEKVGTYQGFFPLFDKVFPSHLTRAIKPEPESFLQVADAFACKPQEILFFDDNPVNIRAACDNGLNAVLVPEPARLEEVLIREKIL